MNSYLFVLLLFAATTRLSLGQPQSQFVFRETSYGKYRGIRYRFKNTSYDFYSAIPYAQPPVGKLRFKAPVKLDDKKKQDYIDATMPAKSCYQEIDYSYDRFPGVEMWNPNTEISEDCLYLNVYVPVAASAWEKKAVMVWFYGGGFQTGTSTLGVYNGAVLSSTYDVVVVSFQYRVGSFGFLHLDTDEAPGNVGLLDQQLVLKWVNRHISEFGGDPGRVTLFGESAGAVSVSYHLLNEKSSSYFKQAVLQSGSANIEYAHLSSEEAKMRARMLGERVGCRQQKKQELVDCLRQKNASVLSHEQGLIPIEDKVVTYPFVPVVDYKFVSHNPVTMIQKAIGLKKKNIMIGYTLDEGTYFLTYQMYADGIYRSLGTTPKLSHHQVISLIEKILGKNATVYEQIIPYYNLGSYTAKYVYVTPLPHATAQQQPTNYDLNPAEALLNDISKIAGDRYFICPLLQLAQSMADNGAGHNLYMYEFAHRMSNNPWPLWTGVLHGDEIAFQFGIPLLVDHQYSSLDKNISAQMMTYLTYFAKYGNPNVPGRNDWRPSKMFSISANPKAQAIDRYPYCRLLMEKIPSYLSASEKFAFTIAPLYLIGIISIIQRLVQVK